MAKIENILDLALTTGGTVNIPVQSNLSAGSFNGHVARITGTQTLTSGFTVSPSGTPVTGTIVITLWEATCTPGANAITIFGATIPPHLAAKKFLVQSTYDGSAWKNIVGASFGESDIIIDDHIVDKTIDLKSKINDETVGDVLVYGASGVASYVNLGTDGHMLLGSASTGATARAMSGHGTITALGVFTIANDVITSAMIVDGTIVGDDLAAATVPPSKLTANANKYTRDITLSFMTTAEVGNINFTIYEDCTIDEINTTVLSPAADDDATLVFKDNGGTQLTDSQTDITTSLTLGNVVSVTPSANNVFSAGDNLLIEMSKTTKTSCKVNVAICITKT